MTSALRCRSCGTEVIYGALLSQLAKDAVHDSHAMTVARVKRTAKRR